jgi:uncharacterized coiled-coil protein SlyX
VPSLRWKDKWTARIISLAGIDNNRKLVFLVLSGLVILQLFWIIALQWELCDLADQVHMQEVRIAQLEQSVAKQNHQIYSHHLTIDSIQKKWNDLNFRVLENTWKLNP